MSWHLKYKVDGALGVVSFVLDHIEVSVGISISQELTVAQIQAISAIGLNREVDVDELRELIYDLVALV